jgi:hypothetical protein
MEHALSARWSKASAADRAAVGRMLAEARRRARQEKKT